MDESCGHREPQGDSEGPQLTGGERRPAHSTLISANETFHDFDLEAAVSVSDECECDGVDAGIASEFTGFEFGQFVVIAARQVCADFAQLLFDDMEVVN